MKCCKLCHLCIIRPDFEKHTFLPLTYICIYKCSFTFVVLKYHYSLRWGRGFSKRYLKDITCGMGFKTCQNMISILKYSPLKVDCALINGLSIK